MKKIVILYHAECPDGFGGAWAAWKKFGDTADYIGVYHNKPAPDGIEGKEVYMVDFVYPLETTKELIAKNKRVTAIDHHISSKEVAKMTENYSYAVNNSGSVLSWIYFHPDKPVPKLLAYIEDRDLFKWNVLGSEAICAFVDSFDYDFLIWDKLAGDLENEKGRVEYFDKGSIILKYQEELIQEFENGAKLVKFEGYDVYVANAPHEFASRLGNNLAIKKPPIAIVWSEDKKGVSVSLRSSDENIDVSKIAEKFGGGGHKMAAGFKLPIIKIFPWEDLDKNE